MMSGPLPASTAAAVFGCSWSPLTVWMVTVQLLAVENSAACRLISASAAGTKLVHWRSWILAPALGLGMVPTTVLLEVPFPVAAPQASRIGPNARELATRPVVLRNFLRDQSSFAR